MANCRGPSVDEALDRERGLKDVEMVDLRRQVELLQLRLQRFESLEHDDSLHESEQGNVNNEEEVNHFYHAPNQAPREEAFPRRPFERNHNFQREFDVNVDIPEFEGRIQPEEFCDWLHTIERVIDFKDVDEN